MAKRPIELPLPLEGVAPASWELMPKDSFPGFYSEIATLTVKEQQWRVGLALNGSALYLFTELPHPDYKKGGPGYSKALYVMPLVPLMKEFAAGVSKNLK